MISVEFEQTATYTLLHLVLSTESVGFLTKKKCISVWPVFGWNVFYFFEDKAPKDQALKEFLHL